MGFLSVFLSLIDIGSVSLACRLLICSIFMECGMEYGKGERRVRMSLENKEFINKCLWSLS